MVSLTAQVTQARSDCLHSLNNNRSSADDCVTPDTSGMAQRNEIRTAIAGLGLQPAQVRFFSCRNVDFGARPIGTSVPQRVGIVFPAELVDDPGIIAPLIHELGHAYQFQEGNTEWLRAQYGVKRIELGADFLAGVLLRDHVREVDRQTFQDNVDLIGDYETMATDWHGRPEDRSAAFRMGYFADFARNPLAQAYRRFQRDEVGAITSW